jgi:nucleoside 2-deoxyribosyltransferase
MSNPYLVYLAGPIAGCTYNEATDWRRKASLLLGEYAQPRMTALSPMRAKHDLARAARIDPDCRTYASAGPFYSSRGIMTRDFSDVKRCDALLVNLLGTARITAGTAMELGWAYALQKPVVVVIEAEGNPHDAHPMLHEAIGGLRFDDLRDAVCAVASVLGT